MCIDQVYLRPAVNKEKDYCATVEIKKHLQTLCVNY